MLLLLSDGVDTGPGHSVQTAYTDFDHRYLVRMHTAPSL